MISSMCIDILPRKPSTIRMMSGFSPRGCMNSITCQSEHGPFLQWFRAERAINLKGRFVPIEHRPFHPPATAIAGNLGKIDKQRAAIALSALVWLNEQIFEIKSGSPKPGGKVMKENS